MSDAIEGGERRTPDGVADHLGAHGSGLRAYQAKVRAEVREKLSAFATRCDEASIGRVFVIVCVYVFDQ